MMNKDDEIVAKRTAIKDSSKAQMEQGTSNRSRICGRIRCGR